MPDVPRKCMRLYEKGSFYPIAIFIGVYCLNMYTAHIFPLHNIIMITLYVTHVDNYDYYIEATKYYDY